MYLDYEKKDKWGLPTVTFDAEIKENEKLMRKHLLQQIGEIFGVTRMRICQIEKSILKKLMSHTAEIEDI